MEDEVKKVSSGVALSKALGGCPAKFRIRRITRTDKEGCTESKQVCIEVDDIEAFRKKMKGRKFAEVAFVYENLE